MTEAEDISGGGGGGSGVISGGSRGGRCGGGIVGDGALYPHCILTVSPLYPHCIPPKRGVCGVLRRGKVEGGRWWRWRQRVMDAEAEGGAVSSLYPHCIPTVSSQYPHFLTVSLLREVSAEAKKEGEEERWGGGVKRRRKE